MRTIYSLIFGLSSKEGHLYHYHCSVERAVSRLCWKYRAIVPKKSFFAALPMTWLPLLMPDPWDRSKSFVDRIKTLVGNCFPLRNFFRSIQREEASIVFLESFELQQLGALMLALFFVVKPRFHFWVLHRYFYGAGNLKMGMYRLFHLFIEWKLGKEHVRYLTDSELLAEAQQPVFQRSVTVLPIPHTRSCNGKKKKPYLYLWWPGSVRKDKGLEVIQHLATQLSADPRVRLCLSESAKPYVGESEQIVFLSQNLSDEDYWVWMETADFVLLPYLAQDYSHRTSGVFVEAICAGAVPVATKRTWMAYELEKHNLSALSFSWGEPLTQILRLYDDLQIKEKLNEMRNVYLATHSEEGFANALRILK